MGVWINSDGLVVTNGVDEAAPQRAGSYAVESDGTKIVELDIRGGLASTGAGDFAAFGSNRILSETIRIPIGVVVEQVDMLVTTAFVGATATLDVGLIRMDRTTEVDFDGLLAAVTVATLVVGYKNVFIKGSTFVGALLTNGTPTTVPSLLTIRANTANFTAGRALLRIKTRQIS